MNDQIPKLCPLLIIGKQRNSNPHFACCNETFGIMFHPYRANWVQEHGCSNGKYLECEKFSKWFWKQVIKNTKVKK